ncbi:MAG: TonB-dependent receptor [Bacteroidales bacterium]|nr:TonB-dependent receptor [Bacteroidales bacterium]
MNNKGTKTILTTLCFIFVAALSYAQNTITVSGIVTDEDNLPVIGASVMVQGSSIGAATGNDGSYTISVQPNATLEYSFVGMKTVTEQVRGRKTINVVLVADNTYLESVVVVGYGTQKKGSITGAVSGINNEELIKTKNENPQNMLTGRIPGVRVWQKSAEPGSYSASMDIRGMGTPLVVIDGVPRTIEDFQRLSANDIENVSVLKDASAAIYGVRGGNGVVLVTTKAGSAGKTSVSYDGSYTMQTPSNLPKLMDAVDAMLIINEQKMNSITGGAPEFSDEYIQSFRDGTRKATDWNKLVIQNVAPQTQHNLSINGGNEKIQYYVGMGYFYQEGFFKTGDLNYAKYNLRSNITAQIIDGLKLNLNISGMLDKQHMPYESSDWIIKNWWRQSEIYPAYADDAETMLNYEGLELEDNPVAKIDTDISGHRKYNKKNFTAAASVEYDFGTLTDALQGLSAKAMFSYDYKLNQNEVYRREYYQYAYDAASGTYNQKIYADFSPSQLRKTEYNKSQTLGQFVLNYKRNFASKHDVGAMVGWEVQKRDGDNFYGFGDLSFSTPYFTALATEGQIVGMDAGTGSFYDLAYEALIGRLNYSYDNRYLFEGQFRYDGSSKFASGHQWGFFPSVSAGWRVSEEPWFKNSALSFVNQLKFRASYGELGDDGDVNYEWATGYTYPAGELSTSGYYGGYAPVYYLGSWVMSASPKAIANENITWYKSKTFNLGVDFEAWNGLFGFSFDYFHRKRTGLFARNTSDLPTIVGATAPLENANSDSHLGFELELSHRNKIGDFSYQVKAIMTLTRNKWLTYVQNTKYANSYDKWRNDNMNNRYQGILFGYEGNGRYESWEDIWSYDIQKDRDVLPGDYKYEDWNGDGEINSLDQHPYAFDQTPWMNYSLSIDGSWKRLDFSLLFQGSALGSMTYGEAQTSIWGSHGGGTLTQFKDRWHPTEVTYDPYDQTLEWISGYYGYTGRYPYSNSTFNTVKTDYLRLKSIEIGYTVPMIRQLKDVVLRVYANAYNPLTITNVKYVDPEHPGGSESYGRLYPLNKTYTIGLNITF